MVNFLPSFIRAATVKDHGSRLDSHFGNMNKCKRMVGGRGNNRDSAFYEE
jgi:hypothetical protein